MVDNDMPGAWPVWIPGAPLAAFISFSHDAPQGGARMDPRGTVGRIYKEDHYTLLLTKYESSGPCGFGEEDFFYVFPIVSL